VEAGGDRSELAHGTLLGPYRIEALLGEGGMGKVFRATRQGETDPIALKVMRSRLSGDEESRKRFLREARAAGEVRHKHLVPVLDAGEAGDRRYLVMPYVPGQNLDSRLGEGPISVPDLVRILAEVASGLDALHRAGLVHRDVKASNVLLDEQGSAALTDFGLAKREDWSRLTKMGQVMGTVDYIAPELLRGEPATPASDLYALGCVTYEMVAGHPPFQGGMFEVGMAHLEKVPPDPTGRRPDAPSRLGTAVLLALDKDPKRRPPTATAFANLVNAAAGGR
jgi:eukaryotic-like serine/threonine-protein kinase